MNDKFISLCMLIEDSVSSDKQKIDSIWSLYNLAKVQYYGNQRQLLGLLLKNLKNNNNDHVTLEFIKVATLLINVGREFHQLEVSSELIDDTVLIIDDLVENNHVISSNEYVFKWLTKFKGKKK
jgi:hypothetical protein